jgi:hypothetical protein
VVLTQQTRRVTKTIEDVVWEALTDFAEEHRRSCGLLPEGGMWVNHIWAYCAACERRLHFRERDFAEIRRRLLAGEDPRTT